MMIRQVSMDEISDGKLYDLNDMVRADCQDCRDCSACCRGMGTSIVLDPFDICRLTGGLNKTFEQLLAAELELNVADGIILPNLKMAGAEGACAFLSETGRCSIHPCRPGICRLFPLGRYYADGGFRYFLQIHECRQENRTKVKVKKWIDTPQPRQYEAYINAWHDYLQDCRMQASESADTAKALSLRILSEFYIKPYDTDIDFYYQFNERLQKSV